MHSIARKALIVLLAGSSLLELLISALLTVRPEVEAAQFHIAITPDTLSLARIMAEFAAFLALLCAVGAWKVYKKDRAGTLLGILCGLHWIVFGVGLYLRYYEVQFLAMDTVRGFLLVGLSVFLRANRQIERS